MGSHSKFPKTATKFFWSNGEQIKGPLYCCSLVLMAQYASLNKEKKMMLSYNNNIYCAHILWGEGVGDYPLSLRLDFQPFWKSSWLPSSQLQGTWACKTAGNQAYTSPGIHFFNKNLQVYIWSPIFS